MRTKLIIMAAVLCCASAPYAAAQQPATTQSTFGGMTGTVDVGVRAGSTDGDEARYERYRDLRNGLFSKIVFGKDTDRVKFNAELFNAGYRDQKYLAEGTNGRYSFTGMWDSIPLNYSYLTSTPWVEGSPGEFALDVNARTQVQNKVPGVVGVPQNVAQLSTPSIYRGLAQPFDLQQRRDTFGGTFGYDLNPQVGFNLALYSTKKSGNQPYGMSFAFNNANELGMPLDNRTNDVSAGLEWKREQGMLRVAWDASWFTNNIHDVVWDNPLRATDTNPYDPSGYSNGNGPAMGRMSMPPDNSMNSISTTGLYKMAANTTLNGTLSFTENSQNDSLIPWTSNGVINTPATWVTFPGLAALPRSTAEAKVHGMNAMLNLTSRPNRYFGLTMRYRFNDHKNLTPEFDAVEYVRFDAVPEETGGITENFNIRQNTFEVTGTYNAMKYTAVRLGYVYDDYNRTGRAFSDMRDYTFRASVDTVGNQYVTVRAMFDHTNRIGSGFSEASIEDGGSQPGLRFYDEADRDRNKGTLLFVMNPIDKVDVNVSFSAGKDTYKGEGHEFGLLDNDNTAINVGVGYTPSAAITLGANYGRDNFTSNQKSRNANPPPDPTWTDPTRDWTLKNDENVNNFDVYIALPKAIERTTIRIDYNYSDSDNGFTFGGPRISSLASAGQFLPLPNVTNKWRRLTADVEYYFKPKIGVGVGYWYEKFDVEDFATIDIPGQEGIPRIDYLGGLTTGYGNRPYTGNTVFARLLYHF